MPELIHPSNTALGTTDTLRWSCSDPDGDELVYDVYFGQSNPPNLIRPDFKPSYLGLNNLEFDKRYYLTITAKDPGGASSKSEIWSLYIVYDSPSLTTVPVTAFTISSAKSGGIIVSGGNIVITSKGVCWSTRPNPTVADNKTVDGVSTDNFGSFVTGLLPSTAYFLRAYAINACGTSYGNELSFRTYSDIVSDNEGNQYFTAIIGNQEWMSQNLKATKFRNGDPIPEINDDNNWKIIMTAGYCNYNNDANNSVTFGRLYNWQAVTDSRNIAPEGWHIPSKEEWETLANYLGGEMVAGGKLKEATTILWQIPNDGATNEVAFTALPGGYRYEHGPFTNLGYISSFWSSSVLNDNNAVCQFINYSGRVISSQETDKHVGASVRCIKDY